MAVAAESVHHLSKAFDRAPVADVERSVAVSLKAGLDRWHSPRSKMVFGVPGTNRAFGEAEADK